MLWHSLFDCTFSFSMCKYYVQIRFLWHCNFCFRLLLSDNCTTYWFCLLPLLNKLCTDFFCVSCRWMLKSSRRWQVLCALGGRVACAGAYSSTVFIQDDVSTVLQSFTFCLVLLLYVSTSVQKGATRRSPTRAYALGGGAPPRLRG